MHQAIFRQLPLEELVELVGEPLVDLWIPVRPELWWPLRLDRGNVLHHRRLAEVWLLDEEFGVLLGRGGELVLHRVARDALAKLKSTAQRCFASDALLVLVYHAELAANIVCVLFGEVGG